MEGAAIPADGATPPAAGDGIVAAEAVADPAAGAAEAAVADGAIVPEVAAEPAATPAGGEESTLADGLPEAAAPAPVTTH